MAPERDEARTGAGTIYLFGACLAFVFAGGFMCPSHGKKKYGKTLEELDAGILKSFTFESKNPFVR